MTELNIDSVVKIKRPGNAHFSWYVKPPLDRTYDSLDMAMKAINLYNTDEGYRERIEAGNKVTPKVKPAEKKERKARRKRNEAKIAERRSPKGTTD